VSEGSTTVLDALLYIARGWSVFPLVPRTKTPAMKLAPLLSGEVRLDATQARALWTQTPDAGIAIVTGKPSGLVVIDVDPRHGGDEAAVRGALGFKPQLVVRTGGGGVHFYCAMGAADVRCGKTSMKGVDRKGSGGFVVAPPSIHPNGEPYKWEAPGAGGKLEALPEWTLVAPAPGPNTEDGSTSTPTPWIAQALLNPEGCEPGAQHETLARLAYWLTATQPYDIAHGMLSLFAGRLPLSRPAEPWTAQHVKELLDSAARKHSARGHTVGASFTTQLPAGTSSADLGERKKRLRSRVKRASEWVLEQSSADWLVDGLIAPSCFTEIVGEVKKGKSTLISQVVHGVLTGDPVLGLTTKKTGVLVYTEQVGISLEATLERAGIRHHPNLHLLTIADTIGEPWAEVVEMLVDTCVEVGAQVLIVDTFARLAGLEGESENSAGAVTLLNPFHHAKLRGIACVFARHSSKSIENRHDVSRAGRGTSAISGEMDTCALLYRPGSEDIRCLRIVSRLGEQRDLVVQYRDGIYHLLERDLHPQKHAANTKRDAVRAAWDSGTHDVAAIVNATGISEKTVRKHLKEFTGSFTVEPEGTDAAADPTTAKE
jgi:hypothetical protein